MDQHTVTTHRHPLTQAHCVPLRNQRRRIHFLDFLNLTKQRIMLVDNRHHLLASLRASILPTIAACELAALPPTPAAPPHCTFYTLATAHQ